MSYHVNKTCRSDIVQNTWQPRIKCDTRKILKTNYNRCLLQGLASVTRDLIVIYKNYIMTYHAN